MALLRITAHNKAMGAVLHTGMAFRHRGNPAASLGVVRMYGLPVLLSGLGSLFLTKVEENNHPSLIASTDRGSPGPLQKLLIICCGCTS